MDREEDDFGFSRDNRRGGEGDDGFYLMNAIQAQTLRYSNFFLTISTNVKATNVPDRNELTNWLMHVLNPLLTDWDVCNGNLLKPSGSENGDFARFPDSHKIIKIRSIIGIEQGNNQRGQVHAHVTLEVAHEYVRQQHGAEGVGQDTGRNNIGVHVNVRALRAYLNERIPEMNIDNKPAKIYVNCRLLTKGTDNSNKWLSVQYLSKDTAKDNNGGTRNLRADERKAGDEIMSRARQILLRAGEEAELEPPSTSNFVSDALEDSPVAAAPAKEIRGKKYTKGAGPKRYAE